jgi:hypothetical protein
MGKRIRGIPQPTCCMDRILFKCERGIIALLKCFVNAKRAGGLMTKYSFMIESA